MRSSILAALLVGAGLAAFGLFELTATTTSGSMHMMSDDRCGGSGGGRMTSTDFETRPDGSFDRAVLDGEIVPVVVPVGQYRLALVADGTRIEPLRETRFPGMGAPPSGPATTVYVEGCSKSLDTRTFRMVGDGAIRVSWWLVADAPACREDLSLVVRSYHLPAAPEERIVAAGEIFRPQLPDEGAFAVALSSDDTRFHPLERPGAWTRGASFSGCAPLASAPAFVAESAGRVRISVSTSG